jgi:hypothetical protein
MHWWVCVGLVYALVGLCRVGVCINGLVLGWSMHWWVGVGLV